MICVERDCRDTATHTRPAPWTATGVEALCTRHAALLDASLDRRAALVEASRPRPIHTDPTLWEEP